MKRLVLLGMLIIGGTLLAVDTETTQRLAIAFDSADWYSDFKYVKIGATTDSTYSPWTSDEIYRGFTSSTGYKKLSGLHEMTYDEDEDAFLSQLSVDVTNMSGYNFFVELVSSTGQTIAYSGYSDYQTIQSSLLGGEGFTGYWKPANFQTAVPEPTSGLLLLLGGALLGLRRKRRVA